MVRTEHGHMLGSRPHLAWGPLAARPARSFGEWQSFCGLPKTLQCERLSLYRGGQTMYDDIQAALSEEWQMPFEPSVPLWMGAWS